VKPIVVVGASLAGLRAAQAVRTGGYDGELILVGEERRPPYTRPPLSKELLAGEHDEARCAFDVSALEATWRLGERATGLDLDRRAVVTADGERLDFGRLIVATGSRARAWAGPGAELDGLLTLRTLDDAIALREAVLGAGHVVVIGAGFVGCEVAASARKLGASVSMVDIAPLPMTGLGAIVGERCRRLHAEHGVDTRLGVGVRGFTGDGRLEAVELQDGTRLAADLAVVALGAIPNTEWLQGSGLTLHGDGGGGGGGVLCDATLTATGDPDVLCAGDVTSWPHPLAGGEAVRIEHWTNAAEQGGVAGRNALLAAGERSAYEAVPYFWTDQYDVKLQAVGFPARATEFAILEQEPDRFVAAGARDGRVVAAVAWNAVRRLMAYRRVLGEQPPLRELRARIAGDEKALGRAPEAAA
jgi:NADPH-dependent 2,4-dienoyl-CoA reductase/sulfur reductase-like enzyme